MNSILRTAVLGLVLMVGSGGAARAQLSGTFPAAGPALPDRVFLQEVSWTYPTPKPLVAVGIAGTNLFAADADGLAAVSVTPTTIQLRRVPEVKGAVRQLVQAGGRLYALTSSGLYGHATGGWEVIAEGAYIGISEFGSELAVASGQSIFRLHAGKLAAWSTNNAPFGLERIAAFNESLYVQGGKRLSYFDGGRFGAKDEYDFPADASIDWGALPSRTVRAMLPLGPALYFATDRGLGVLRGMSLATIRGADGLPFEDLTCLAPGFDGDLWIGTSHGAIRKTGSEYHYFAGERWLPGNHVYAIAVSGRDVLLATDRGLAIIRYHPMTLEAKAAHYERQIEAWGQKRLGFLHKLEWDGALGEYVREVSDNDGGFTADYLAAHSYRYAVTKDPAARAEALNTFHAMVWLERMTGIEGLPARSVWAKGEKGHKAGHGSGGYAAEWNDVPGGLFEWKGDTSSDELCGHFYGVSLFLELAAQGPEIAMARDHLRKIAGHLVDRGWQLHDRDGQPTRWGRWDPDYFKTNEGHFDRGLQATELLAFIRTAADLTGEEKFLAAERRLVELGYPDYTLRQRQLFPPDSLLHFEDQLAFWSYWNLLRRERNPVLRSVYRRSFERTWEVLRLEQQPWFNLVYGILTGNDCEPDVAMRHLREWPLDLTVWSYQNSHRADLHTPPGYTAFKGAPRPFSPREKEPMRWDNWTMHADGGTGGHDVIEPGGWLVVYWMARYHGYLAAPTESVAGDVPIQIRRGTRPGAAPYAGPPRPAL